MRLPSSSGSVPSMTMGRPLSSKPFGPRLLGVGLAGKELARFAVERVVERVAIWIDDELSRFASNGRIDQKGDVGGVPVVRVVRGELEVPFQLAGFGIERDKANRCRGCRLCGRRRSNRARDCRCPSRRG